MTRQIPMLFSAAMMQAHIDGLKTETRRTLRIKGYPGFYDFGLSDTRGYDWHFRRKDGVWCDFRHDELIKLLPVQPGDLIWVKETWRTILRCDTLKPSELEGRNVPIQFVVDEPITDIQKSCAGKTRVSIHMPKWASRLTLRVKNVRVERLQEITRDSAIAEGLIKNPLASNIAKEVGCDWSFEGDERYGSPVGAYSALWNSINGPESWAQNPWVIATQYEPIWKNVLEVD